MQALFGSGAKIKVKFADAETRATATVPGPNDTEVQQYLFGPNDSVCGTIDISTSLKKLDHQGIELELVGQIEMLYERSSVFEFTSMVRPLEGPSAVEGSKTYLFDFGSDVEKMHESYDGINVRCRYFLRISIARQYSSNIVHEETFRVFNYTEEPDTNSAIKMEVGIEDCLHIEFEYNKNKYHLKDVVLGKIFFLLVRIKIKNMELAIIKRESCGTGANVYNESETVAKFEIMDGAPVRGESIPIRLFLSGFDKLTPTFRNINNKFSVKYFLNLVLVDEEDRRYFKQQEVFFYRKEPSPGAQ